MHTIARAPSAAVQGEAGVLVYDSPEFKQLNDASSTGRFTDEVMRSDHRAKFFSLVPFFVEAKYSHKNFVLRMELFANAGFLKLHVLRLGGVQQIWVPIKQVVPITPYDYWCASWMVWFKQNQTLDLDMIYANHVTKEMYVFDKDGEWKDEGINHQALAMDATYNETNWYDEFSAHSF